MLSLFISVIIILIISVIAQKLNYTSVKEPFYGMGDLAIASFANANQKQSSKN